MCAPRPPSRCFLVALASRGGDPLELGFEPADRLLALRALAFGLGGVVADDEALGRVALPDVDLLDAEVVAHGLVAALARQRGSARPGCRRASARRRSSARPPRRQVAQVLITGEAAVDDRHDPPEPPAPQVVLDLRDDRHVIGVPGPAPHPHRDPLPRDGQADHDLRQVGPVILGVAEDAERAVAVLGLVALEVGAGGVEEQQVDLEVKRSAQAKNTASCTFAWASASTSRSIAR